MRRLGVERRVRPAAARARGPAQRAVARRRPRRPRAPRERVRATATTRSTACAARSRAGRWSTEGGIPNRLVRRAAHAAPRCACGCRPPRRGGRRGSSGSTRVRTRVPAAEHDRARRRRERAPRAPPADRWWPVSRPPTALRRRRPGATGRAGAAAGVERGARPRAARTTASSPSATGPTRTSLKGARARCTRMGQRHRRSRRRRRAAWRTSGRRSTRSRRRPAVRRRHDLRRRATAGRRRQRRHGRRRRSTPPRATKARVTVKSPSGRATPLVGRGEPRLRRRQAAHPRPPGPHVQARSSTRASPGAGRC